MKYLTNSLGILILSLSTIQVHAVTIQECVDDNTGEKSFQKNCPPGTTSANTVKLQTGKPSNPLELGPSSVDITLYAVPDCEACDVARQTLKNYSAAFTEVNIDGSDELQNKLKATIGGVGRVTVPVVIFGEKQIVGYDKATLISELEAAGFKDKNKKEAEAEEKTSEEEKQEQ